MKNQQRTGVSSRRDFVKSVGATALLAGFGAVTTNQGVGEEPKTPLTYLSAKNLAKLIADRQVSAEEVAEAHLKRIEEVNPKLNAIVQMDAKQVLSEARQTDKELSRGKCRGPLHGVPFTIKDCILTQGVITTNGCPELRKYVPKEDATVVKRLKQAGGIFLGKTNVPEMCFGDTDNLVYGMTNNPYNIEYSPGGSSGGEASIIAAGGSPLGIGTDIGGSIRHPAHSCGIAGIKPTSRRVPETGVLSTYPWNMSDWNAVGPMARYVDDLYLGLKIISGPDLIDPNTVPVPPVGDPSKIRIDGLWAAYFTDDGIGAAADETLEAVERAVQALKESGIAVENRCPPGVDRSPDLWLQAVVASWPHEVRCWRTEYARMANTEVSEERSPFFGKLVEGLEIAHAKGEYGPEYWSKFNASVMEFRAKMLAFMREYDVIVSPVVRDAVGPHMTPSEVADLSVDGFPKAARVAFGGFFVPYNLTGWPAVVVRAGTSAKGIPIGVQVAAKPWREDVALAVAKIIEEKCGGWQPPVSL